MSSNNLDLELADANDEYELEVLGRPHHLVTSHKERARGIAVSIYRPEMLCEARVL